MDVPRPLKHLVQKVMRGFYSVEQVIVIDLLIRRIVLKEDEMVELLRFERKQLRTILQLLKNDKLIKFKLRMETGTDGKAFRQNYYYINYKDFVNVIKYKLDHIRKKFEVIDRDNTSRASFICSYCNKSFTDLEVDMLLDISTGELRCTHCGSDVSEDPNHLPKADSRKMLAKFNETMEPLYLLLKEIEDIRLTADLLDPDIDSRIEQANANDMNSQIGNWADKRKGIGIFGNFSKNDVNNFNVKIEENSSEAAGKKQVKKEQPIWMIESTVSGASAVYNNKNKINELTSNILSKPINETIEFSNCELSSEQAKEILDLLLSNERSCELQWLRISKLFGFFNEEKTAELVDTQELNSQIYVEFLKTLPLISVNNCFVSMVDLSDQDILLMQEHEIQDFIRIAQQIYSSIFDI